ncbi:hypothetical protein [Chromatium okenii]|jgi:hypothetical protein|uniref:hypothetical protein n=1 Tax=Chromatium okenii TaxID=61644 RepID=UPI0026EA585C|nr:hypothetical protein [Chromatium okenii]MBV5309550.1 hypothetical protein [Chromatium okenii]
MFNSLIEKKQMNKNFMIGIASVCMASNVQANLVTIDISSYANSSLSNTIYDSSPPQGNQTLGGISFLMGNVWNSSYNTDHTVSIAINKFGVNKVYSLINTWWGTTDSNKAYVDFLGTNGAYYSLNLIGGYDIRDYNQSSYTNTINSPNTVNVYVQPENSSHRLDMQSIDLPDAFMSETLETIRFRDLGGADYQRIFLTGLTVDVSDANTIPLPTPAWLLLSGLAGLLVNLRKLTT